MATLTGDAVGDSSAAAVAVASHAQAIGPEEIALYDRQIRLWGVQAQQKLRTSNILLIHFRAVANEVAKNLVLAGIGSLTIVDHAPVSEEDLGAQFFLSEQHVGQNRAEAAAPQIRKLNPRVSVYIDTEDIRLKEPEYFTTFDVIIATDLDLVSFERINESARLCARPFYAAGSHGFYGYVFADLITHDFVIEREKSNVPTVLRPESATRSIIASSTKKENGKTIEMVTKREQYTPLRLANAAPLPSEYLHNRRRLRQVPPLLTGIKALWEFQRLKGHLPSHNHADLELFTTLATDAHKSLQLPPETLTSDFLRSFLHNLGSEIAPVTAILGGQLAQDVINVLGHREQPIQNLLLFDGEETKGPIYAMHPLLTAVDASML
ncbi:MAG: hypothetical protein M1838_003764 [Thelocarpon superellum]|nr:MAG: hypothetical protein M1838_003764 [Thelocarpon superellum]